MTFNLSRKLDSTPVRIDELQAISAARLVEPLRKIKYLNGFLSQGCGRLIDVCATLHTKRDVMDTAAGSTMQAEQIMFGRRSAKVHGVSVAGNSLQSPDIGIKASLLLKIRRE